MDIHRQLENDGEEAAIADGEETVAADEEEDVTSMDLDEEDDDAEYAVHTGQRAPASRQRPRSPKIEPYLLCTLSPETRDFAHIEILKQALQSYDGGVALTVESDSIRWLDIWNTQGYEALLEDALKDEQVLSTILKAGKKRSCWISSPVWIVVFLTALCSATLCKQWTATSTMSKERWIASNLKPLILRAFA